MYKRISLEEWIAKNVEVELRVEEFYVSTQRLAKVLGKPITDLPEGYPLNNISGIYVFESLTDSNEIYTLYERDNTGEMSNGERGFSVEQFWDRKQLMPLRIGGVRGKDYTRFTLWLHRRLDGESQESTEVFNDAGHDLNYGSNIPGLDFLSVAHYVDPNAPEKALKVARWYSEMKNPEMALLRVDWAGDCLENLVESCIPEDEDEFTPMRKNLCALLRKVQAAGIAYLIVAAK